MVRPEPPRPILYLKLPQGTIVRHSMPLAPGARLGPYEILAPLGAGGMGEVYRATDAKSGRDIALKVRPAERAHDPERLARFRREAKALAQLDHPNIVTIHSFREGSERYGLITKTGNKGWLAVFNSKVVWSASGRPKQSQD